jgi:hypothetical protein
MADFTASTPATFTPSTTTPGAGNYTLMAGPTTAIVNGNMGKVKFISWGGQGTTSTGYRTRWARSSTDPTGNATTLGVGKGSNPLAANLCSTAVSYATTNPTLVADANNLYAIAWNVLGGGGILVLPIGSEWTVIGSGTAGTSYIQCINTSGTDANLSTYAIGWQE